MLCGYPPFNGKEDETIYLKIQKGEFSYREKDWLSVSDEAKDLINKCLTYDPKKRITAQQALEHPWVKKFAHEEVKDTAKLQSVLHNI